MNHQLFPQRWPIRLHRVQRRVLLPLGEDIRDGVLLEGSSVPLLSYISIPRAFREIAIERGQEIKKIPNPLNRGSESFQVFGDEFQLSDVANHVLCNY